MPRHEIQDQAGGRHRRCRLSSRASPSYARAVSPPRLPNFGRRIAALLVGLLMLVSVAPCTGFAAPARRPVAEAPGDACRSHHPAAPAAGACVQLACQQGADTASAPVAYLPATSAACFIFALDHASGRTDAPPLPPPRRL